MDSLLQQYPSIIFLHVFLFISILDGIYYFVKRVSVRNDISLKIAFLGDSPVYIATTIILLLFFGVIFMTVSDVYYSINQSQSLIIILYHILLLSSLLVTRMCKPSGIFIHLFAVIFLKTPDKYIIKNSDHPYLLKLIAYSTSIYTKELNKFDPDSILLIVIHPPVELSIHNLSSEKYIEELLQLCNSQGRELSIFEEKCWYCNKGVWYDEGKEVHRFQKNAIAMSYYELDHFCKDCSQEIIQVAVNEGIISEEEILYTVL